MKNTEALTGNYEIKDFTDIGDTSEGISLIG